MLIIFSDIGTKVTINVIDFSFSMSLITEDLKSQMNLRLFLCQPSPNAAIEYQISLQCRD
jgi:hypothetical protein